MDFQDNILELKNVSLHFGGLKAVNDVSFSMKSNEILSLIGPNGAGKTSTFNLITGVYTPTSGDVIYKGKRINNFKPYKITQEGMARTFQNIRLFKQLTVLENIILAMHNLRKIDLIRSVLSVPYYFKELAKVTKQAEEYLDYFGLIEHKNTRAENLPYGKQRELEICRALATGADVLLLDEPAAGMNPAETEQLMITIKRIRNELSKGVFLIEHDMKLVMGISDRVVVLDYGSKIAEGKPEDIRNNRRVIDAYLGKEVEENA
ncbi:MAG: ABC transporter ATP-binding protein [Deferribacterales bacterium]|nr:ABC transporter ATP-binding protein [Deferribacterales bacterium]